MNPDPITAADAGRQLGKDAATIRQWGTRYQARKLGIIDRKVWYDYTDLATIDGCIARGEDVPATPELRDRLREDRRAGYQQAA